MSTLRIIIISYIAFLLVLIVLLQAVAKHQKRFEVIFTYDMDYVFYEMAKNILDVKDSLYDYKNALEVLYHDKKQIFTKPIRTYQQQFTKIQENVDYLEKLLQKPLFTEKFKKRLTQNYRTLQRTSRISRALHTILIFFTLGIAKFWA